MFDSLMEIIKNKLGVEFKQESNRSLLSEIWDYGNEIFSQRKKSQKQGEENEPDKK